jgi:copper(I)-binding protein
MRRAVALIALLAGCAAAGTADAVVVSVGNPWIKSAATDEASTSAYMDLLSDIDLKLVGASSPWVEKVEIRAVELKDGLPVERSLSTLDVPANVKLRLAPGGNYLALSAIKRGFGNGDYVPITLRFEDAKRTPHLVDVNLEARGVTLPKRRAPDAQ